MPTCKIFAASPVILYLVEFTVGLLIENRDASCIFHNFL